MIRTYVGEVDLLKITKLQIPLTKYVQSDIFYGLWSLLRSLNELMASEMFLIAFILFVGFVDSAIHQANWYPLKRLSR